MISLYSDHIGRPADRTETIKTLAGLISAAVTCQEAEAALRQFARVLTIHDVLWPYKYLAFDVNAAGRRFRVRVIQAGHVSSEVSFRIDETTAGDVITGRPSEKQGRVNMLASVVTKIRAMLKA